MALNVVMLGAPGAGKGTQAERFARERGVPKISTGDILREAVAADTELGRLARATMEAGRLVSDDVVIAVVRDRLEQRDAANGFVLDGFPRTVTQATALDEVMRHRSPLVIVDLAVPTEELVKRIASRRVCKACGATWPGMDGGSVCARCGGELMQRPDDSAEVVRERLEVYLRDTRPLVEFYRPRSTFRTIDGNQPPDRVAAELRAAVDAVIASTVQDGRANPPLARPLP
jgi:adenylate kinase